MQNDMVRIIPFIPNIICVHVCIHVCVCVGICVHQTGRVHIKVISKYRDTYQSDIKVGRREQLSLFTF